jgi:tetratricopeptide (TPR) repeat protein
MMESSAIDLSSHPSIAGLDLDAPEELPSFKPTPSMQDVPFPEMAEGATSFLTDEDESSVNLDLPDIRPDDSRITSREELAGSGFDTEFPTDPAPLPAASVADDFAPPPAQPRPIRRQPVSVSTGQIEISEDDLTAARPTKKGGGWLMPGLVGLLIGAGGVGGAYFGGMLPSTGEEQKTVNPNPIIPKKDVPPQVALPGDPTALMAMGKFDDAIKKFDEMVQAEPASPVALSGRGKARWQQHLATLKDGMLPGSKTDAVKEATTDFETALNEWVKAQKPVESEPAALDAAVFRGQIYEVQNDASKAYELYESGAKEFSDANKGIFEAHKSRLKVLKLVAAPKGNNETMRLAPQELLAITILLQNEPLGKGSGELKEAGQGFWMALDLASQGKYAEAKNLLQLAVAKHKAQRLANPGARLNPISDPNEQIFEAACQQLMEAWDAKLKAPKVGPSADPKELAALKMEVETLTTAKATLEKEKKSLELMLTEAKANEKTLGEMNTTYEKTNKDLMTKITDLDKQIVSLGDMVKVKDKQIADYGDVKKTVDAANLAKAEAEKAKMVAESEVKKLAQEVKDKEKIIDGFGDAKKMIDEAKLAKEKAEGDAKKFVEQVMKLQGETKKALEIVQGANIAEKELEPAVKQLVKAYEEAKGGKASPRERLDVLLQVMAASENAGQAKRALQDADKILTETKEDEYIAKAVAVKALAQRNLQDYTEARKLISEVVKLPGYKADEFWGQEIKATAEMLSSPDKFVSFATIVPTKENIQKELSKLDKAIKAFPAEAFPKEYSMLLARRAGLKLDGGDVTGAEADANEAKSVPSAESFMVLARIAQRKEDYAAAINYFGEVVKLAAPNSLLSEQAKAGQLRARLLQMQKASDKQTRLTPEQLMLFAILLQPVTSPDAQASIDEANRMIKSDDASIQAEGFFLLALTYGRDPKTARDGLENFRKGLKAKGLVPVDHEQTLLTILKSLNAAPVNTGGNTPKIDVPNIPVKPSPKSLEVAEKFFNDGYRRYFHHDFGGAEQSFLQAIGQAQDARFYYFLALSQVGQGRNADGVFSIANELERKAIPETKQINDALERVQGEARKTLELKRP